MAESVGGLVADIGLNVAGLRTDIKQSNRELKRGTNKMNRHLGSLRKGVEGVSRSFKGLVGVISIDLFARHIKETINSADQLLKLTDRLGGTTEAFSELQFVAERGGVAFNTLTMGLQRMTRRIAEAAQGYGEAKGALKELHLSATDLARLPIDKQFEAIADALFEVKNQSDRVRLAMKLLDSEGVSLLQLMTKGAKGIREYRDEARDLGVTLSRDMAEKARDAKDAMTNLSAEWSAFTRDLTFDAIPALSTVVGLMDDLRQFIPIAIDGLNKGLDRVLGEESGDAISAAFDEFSKANKELKSLQELANSRVGQSMASLTPDAQTKVTQLYEHWQRLIRETANTHKEFIADNVVQSARETGESAGAEFVSSFRAEVASIGGPLSADTLIPTMTADQVFPLRSITAAVYEDMEEIASDTADEIDQRYDSLAFSMGSSLQRSFSDTFLGVETSFGDLLRRMAADLASSALLRGLASLIPGPIGDVLSAAIPGFASGGSFKVGGSGGTDSQLVAFKASPNETVSVTRPGQSQSSMPGVIRQEFNFPISFPTQLEAFVRNVAGPAGRDAAMQVLMARQGKF